MTRAKYTVLAGVFLVLYLGARVTDLDLGGFGLGLLFIAAVFGLMAVVNPNNKSSNNG
ncbi:hypothetical protein [Qipengyuania seohaensis]|uniref:hypothetical protein n=1 Tax=Qipengyuania seohaensis TaxID=266951 RepID=UPI0018E23EAC|nr:hypothetical protein [Qipengyuania seohaensis]